ncbi:orf 34 [Ateline gammaherpesvirus 3]|uniref:Orf 34 n=1 Tax=Ateline herpesvirus 3 TaxID=85618 RepID=Q9YTN1_ATHV3|nr:orf 34 [Ateline gammaherpesvirus 3]AAC95560.1 orf 34 [Ateline gammaherpesvirus 3]
MFNLVNLVAKGNPELKKRYSEGLDLAISMSENIPDQFKLIETPTNSFLLVSNVMPEDTRPWQTQLQNCLDFSNLHLPKLDKLNQICTGYVHQEDTVKKLETVPPYLVYDTEEWKLALQINKDSLIYAAIEMLANPKNWQGLYPIDPLPYIWLLFYGKKSFCASPDCIYLKKYNIPGPMLLPPHMYKPEKNISSFISHVCQYVKLIYGEVSDPINFDIVPFDHNRIKEAVEELKQIDLPVAHLSNFCLLCTLHKQNMTASRGSGDICGYIVLSGEGEKYITTNIIVKRCMVSGDCLIVPSYNIPLLMQNMDINYEQQ